jgi:hypothetical protein
MEQTALRLPLKVLSRRAEQLAWHYHIAKIRQVMQDVKLDAKDEQIRIFQGDDNDKLIYAVDMILDTMEPEKKAVIVNDYLLKKYPYWWQEHYARSTYYRIKYRALMEFTSYFYQ